MSLKKSILILVLTVTIYIIIIIIIIRNVHIYYYQARFIDYRFRQLIIIVES